MTNHVFDFSALLMRDDLISLPTQDGVNVTYCVCACSILISPAGREPLSNWRVSLVFPSLQSPQESKDMMQIIPIAHTTNPCSRHWQVKHTTP